jgi:dimethylargininase
MRNNLMPLPEYQNALVREPSPRYAAFYALRGIEVHEELAHRQHAAYAQALRDAGLNVTTIPAHPQLHDCVFIEDTAIVWDRRALITRMTPLREGEQREVERWLAGNGFEIAHLPAGARIEGGDVMQLEDATYVGLTERTNAAGVEALREFLSPFGRTVHGVSVSRCLHLKSAMTYLGDRTILISPALIDFESPGGYSRLEVPASEAHAGNALRIGDTILFAAGFPKTAQKLSQFARAHHCKLVELEISEYQKGDGAITCSSILF